jgi:acyl-CoA thioesterase-1
MAAEYRHNPNGRKEKNPVRRTTAFSLTVTHALSTLLQNLNLSRGAEQMRTVKIFFMTVFSTALFFSFAGAAEKPYVPEAGSDEIGAKKTAAVPYDKSLPDVLIIGDSISIGYTPYVIEGLRGVANVIRIKGNGQGTRFGVENIDKWILHEKPWAVIHFNWGLHDLKRWANGRNSSNPNDPRQAEINVYEKNMELLVSKLAGTKAKLIFATTTPYPSGVVPWRDPEDAARYNDVALRIMQKNGIQTDDLYTAIQPKLAEFQKPKNVHFEPGGSKFLADAVVKSIKAALEGK